MIDKESNIWRFFGAICRDTIKLRVQIRFVKFLPRSWKYSKVPEAPNKLTRDYRQFLLINVTTDSLIARALLAYLEYFIPISIMLNFITPIFIDIYV